MAEGISLVLVVIAYVAALIIIMLSLTNIIGKAFENRNYAAAISGLCAMVLIFFGAFAFAKFLFGF